MHSYRAGLLVGSRRADLENSAWSLASRPSPCDPICFDIAAGELSDEEADYFPVLIADSSPLACVGVPAPHCCSTILAKHNSPLKHVTLMHWYNSIGSGSHHRCRYDSLTLSASQELASHTITDNAARSACEEEKVSGYCNYSVRWLPRVPRLTQSRTTPLFTPARKMTLYLGTTGLMQRG